MARVSPWSNQTVAPLQAAGALIPLIDTPSGPVLDTECHGTAFFVSDAGFFLTAGHVVDQFRNFAPPLVVAILSAPGAIYMPVEMITLHPSADVALGRVILEENEAAKPSPLILATARLQVGTPVAILGYPRTSTEHAIGPDGDALSRCTFTPDYYEGDILDHYPQGVGLAKGPAYVTSVTPPPWLGDLSGASGGPMVASDTLRVHGLLSSSSESYATCIDIRAVLDWELFTHATEGNLTVEQFSRRYPGLFRIS